jgi:hypothetical protein
MSVHSIGCIRLEATESIEALQGKRMYQPRTPGYRKSNAEMRWALPDRVFFACGACHILAYAFLQRWGQPEMQAVWIKPDADISATTCLSMAAAGSSTTMDIPPSPVFSRIFGEVLVNDGLDGTARSSHCRPTC